MANSNFSQDYTIRIFLACAISIACLIPSLILTLTLEPFQRGFSCNDSDLSYPYKEERIPYFLLILLCFLFSSFVVLIVEACNLSRSPGYIDINGVGEDGNYLASRPTRLLTLVRCFENVVPLLLTLTIVELIKNLVSYSLGFLRPHFITLCQPNCTQGFVLEPSCTSGSERQLRLARLSFPCGHAAIAMACATYTTCYLHAKLGHRTSLKVPVAFFSVTYISVAMYLGFQTTSSHMHHVQDVIGGLCLGWLSAWITAQYCLEPIVKRIPLYTAEKADVCTDAFE